MNTKCIRKIFVGLTLFLLAGYCGCGGGGGDDSDGEQAAFSELDIQQSGRRYHPTDLVVLYLEPSDATTTSHGDNEIGIERVPYRIDEAMHLSFSVKAEVVAKITSVTLLDSNQAEVFRIDAQNRTVSVEVEPGDYELVIDAHENHNLAALGGADHKVVFIQYVPTAVPDSAQSAQAKAPTSYAGSMNYGYCSGCNLTGANLSNGNFSFGAYTHCNFTGANLSGSNFFDSIMNNDIFDNANLSHADFGAVDLTAGSFVGTNASNADFSQAELKGSSIGQANLTGANLSKAIWSDGSVCGANAVGTCH